MPTKQHQQHPNEFTNTREETLMLQGEKVQEKSTRHFASGPSALVRRSGFSLEGATGETQPPSDRAFVSLGKGYQRLRRSPLQTMKLGQLTIAPCTGAEVWLPSVATPTCGLSAAAENPSDASCLSSSSCCSATTTSSATPLTLTRRKGSYVRISNTRASSKPISHGGRPRETLGRL